MKWFKKFSIIALCLGILFGCGSSDEQPITPGPGLAPINPGSSVPGTNCKLLTGGTPLSSLPFVGTLVSSQVPNYQWSTQLSSITLSVSVSNNLGYSFQNTVLASGAVSLKELSYLYNQGTSTSIPTACVSSQSGNNTGYFSNGQIRSLVLTGTLSVPYQSPFSWGGYNNGTPGTNPVGNQVIQVLVGSTCTARLVPSYGNNTPGRIRGCVTVRIGNQTLNYQSQ